MSDAFIEPDPSLERAPLKPDDLVFVGFNSRVAALDRTSGEKIWDWTSPEGSGFVALILDGDRLIASVNGYTYCLDPVTGVEIWRNPLKGMGTGVSCLASVRAGAYAGLYAMLARKQQDDAAAAHAAT
ncbi:MAG: PQQ-binding-like beta-propeller repeat protein [Pirellulales bacterium]